jgi:hypothetical protein
MPSIQFSYEDTKQLLAFCKELLIIEYGEKVSLWSSEDVNGESAKLLNYKPTIGRNIFGKGTYRQNILEAKFHFFCKKYLQNPNVTKKRKNQFKDWKSKMDSLYHKAETDKNLSSEISYIKQKVQLNELTTAQQVLKAIEVISSYYSQQNRNRHAEFLERHSFENFKKYFDKNTAYSNESKRFKANDIKRVDNHFNSSVWELLEGKENNILCRTVDFSRGSSFGDEQLIYDAFITVSEVATDEWYFMHIFLNYKKIVIQNLGELPTAKKYEIFCFPFSDSNPDSLYGTKLEIEKETGQTKSSLVLLRRTNKSIDSYSPKWQEIDIHDPEMSIDIAASLCTPEKIKIPIVPLGELFSIIAFLPFRTKGGFLRDFVVNEA